MNNLLDILLAKIPSFLKLYKNCKAIQTITDSVNFARQQSGSSYDHPIMLSQFSVIGTITSAQPLTFHETPT